jgi:hypothetical protein
LSDFYDVYVDAEDTRARLVAQEGSAHEESTAGWYSEACEENNSLLRIGNEAYVLSAEGYLMPSKKESAGARSEVLPIQVSAKSVILKKEDKHSV